MGVASKNPVLLEGAKTIAGEKGTVSERSFVMASASVVREDLV
jgi:nucleoside-diphosphate kinase